MRVLVACLFVISGAMAAPWSALAQSVPAHVAGSGDPFNQASFDEALPDRLQTCLRQELDHGPQACLFQSDWNPCFENAGRDFDAVNQCYLAEAAAWDALVKRYYVDSIDTARESDESGRQQGVFSGAEQALIAAQQAFVAARPTICRGQWASQAAGDNGPGRNFAFCMVRLTAQRAHQLYAWGLI